MVSRRNHPGTSRQKAFTDPVVRFVTDFTRLVTDVNRLMVDMSPVKEAREAGKPNGDARKTTLNAPISVLRDNTQLFVESLKTFGSLLDRVPVPLMELDAKGRILRTNKACADVLNGSGSSLPGKSLFSLVAEGDIKQLREQLAIARHSNKPCVAYVSIVKGGKNHFVKLQIRRQFAGEAGYVALVDGADQFRTGNGVPALKRRDDALSMHELVVALAPAQTLYAIGQTVGKYCSKAFHSPTGMMFLERDGSLQLVSQWRSAKIPKKHLEEEIIKRGPVLRAFRTGVPIVWREQYVSDSKVSQFLNRLLRRCNCQSAAFLPISALHEQPIGVLALALPHTAENASALSDDLVRLAQIVAACIMRVRAYDEALAARVKAEDAIEKKEEFLSIVSHELKNSMMPILGWAVALGSGTLPPDKQNLALEGIVRHIRTLNYMIEDLFDAARISSGKLRLQPVRTRIQDVAREALLAIQNTGEIKKLRISTDISEAIPPFIADARRLQQVLVNLLNNAVKFTPAGGSISVQVRRRGDSVECVVSDTGKGIERKFLPFVFERFRQENRRSRVHPVGLGLGLAIVREIVVLHGGSIQALSQGIDKGSTFIVRLPMHRRHFLKRNPAANGNGIASFSKHIARGGTV
jgi:PAS domain S-box-containing protein